MKWIFKPHIHSSIPSCINQSKQKLAHSKTEKKTSATAKLSSLHSLKNDQQAANCSCCSLVLLLWGLFRWSIMIATAAANQQRQKWWRQEWRVSGGTKSRPCYLCTLVFIHCITTESLSVVVQQFLLIELYSSPQRFHATTKSSFLPILATRMTNR